MGDGAPQQPLVEVDLGGCRVTLLGTAHVSKVSAAKVAELFADTHYQAVAVELCPSRFAALTDAETLARLDLAEVLRQGKASMVAASLALAAYQQRLATQLGVEPGAEFRAAIKLAEESHRPVLLIDREIGVTLRRITHNLPWWKKFALLSGLMGSVFSRAEIDAAEIERLKEGDVLESAFAQFAADDPALYAPLIAERDLYMALRLRQEVEAGSYTRLLVVVGAGHLRGIASHLSAPATPAAPGLAVLDRVPPPGPWLRRFGWLIVGLVLAGFAIGFARSPGLGWRLVVDWVVINGGLAALGALVAAAHPLTIAAAFIAAPLTSLNPTVGVGIVTAAVEIYLRRPKVGDFHRLREDTTTLRGWWGNRVSRILLVFLLSTVGSAAGTYLAGLRIFGRLLE